jgi:hypothetical protein
MNFNLSFLCDLIKSSPVPFKSGDPQRSPTRYHNFGFTFKKGSDDDPQLIVPVVVSKSDSDAANQFNETYLRKIIEEDDKYGFLIRAYTSKESYSFRHVYIQRVSVW